MKVQAKYHIKNINPFIPKIEDLCKQVRYAEANVPDDTDWEVLTQLAKEKTPEGFEFISIKEIKIINQK